MKNIPLSALPFLFFMLSMACHETNTQNREAVRQEIRSREIVHATPGQIAERATAIGDSLIEKSENQLMALIKVNPDTACPTLFSQIADSLKKRYDCTVIRLGFDPQELNRAETKTEREVWDAYFYNRENRLPISANLQKSGEKVLIYSKALVAKNAACVTCHASTDKPWLKGQVGDTIGIWSLRLSKKNVIMSFVD